MNRKTEEHTHIPENIMPLYCRKKGAYVDVNNRGTTVDDQLVLFL